MRKLPKRLGFTLIEVLITLALVSVLISIFFTATNIWRWIRHVRWQTFAKQIASREIEQLRNTPYDNLPASGSFSDSNMTKIPQGSGQMNIAVVNGQADLSQVKVTVFWVQEGQTKSIQLDTLMSKNGLND